MGSSLYLRMLVMLCCFNLNLLTNSYSSMQPLCHEDESSALLQFKHSFVLQKFASVDPSAYPKVESWKLDGSTSDCCSWDGVECDHDTGRVIGLDLSSSFLHGSISSNSSLFNLVHLRRLNLADNHFNSSQIPTRIGSLSRLRSLNLSSSVFLGQIPWEISSFSKLVFLDLSRNTRTYSVDSVLKLEKPSLRDLVQNLTNLKVLNLREVNISSKVPSVLSNRSSLTHLNLESCLLNGEFPTAIFHLPNLQSLHVGQNEDLTGYLPEFHHSSCLKSLDVRMTSFSGALPSSIGNLESLIELDLFDCYFSGTIPNSVGNLTDLSYLNIASNKLHGMIPSSISQLEDLEILGLDNNNLSGKVEIDIFLKLPHLTQLHLSWNNLTVLETNSTNATLPKFNLLRLSSCNLREFPDFLRVQNELEVLFLSNNQIHGQIPLWLRNITKENLHVICLQRNSLTGFEKSPDLIPWQSLIILDLGFNQLQGSLPVPPPSTLYYYVPHNKLSGEISPSICHNSSLSELVLSYNNLNGMIPQCLANSSEVLSVLNLRSNNFHGIIPQTFANGIKMIDMSENQLHGQVPPSLANCTMLQMLVLGNNHIEGTFPFLLGALPNLQVLILRSNKFHGVIENPEIHLAFPKLRIIDLSRNSFSGNLPSNYFKNWNAMKMEKLGKLTYMEAIERAGTYSGTISGIYSYSITIAQKGTQREFEKIISAFVAIDLSNNKFSGEIPESLGSLIGLQVLNISYNNLTGAIPSSLASLTALESLDLSRNVLSGKIPQELTQLTFLEVLDVSHNHLTGRIPRGNQFDTFENSSYKGNSGLCGVPLSTSCENPKGSPPPLHSSQKDETGFTSGIYWMVTFMGYGGGLIVGLVIGTTLTRRYHEWFVETFRRKKKIQKKQKRKERRN